MNNENKGFPNGWGDNSEDDDYGFVDDTDEDDEDSAWGNSSSPFKNGKPVTSSDTNGKANAQSDSAASNANNNSDVASAHDAPDQNVKKTENTSSPAPTLNVPQNQIYAMQKQKTSSVLIIVIIILVLIIVILGGMFFMMSKDKKSDKVDKSSTISEVTEVTTEITKTSTNSESQTTTSTAPVESTTQTTISDQYTSDEVSAMFSAYIAENPDPNRTYDNSDYGYALIDLNNDGTQELLITEGEKEKGSPWIIGVYTIKNSKLTLLMGFDSRFPGSLYEDNIISFYSSLGQGGGTAFYKYTSGDSLDMVDIISFDYSSGTKVMYHNSNVITEAESYSILANYNPIQFEPKSLKINIQPTTSAPTETYAFYGIVATDSDSLNLRDKPSTDSNVITKLPKGTKASVYYVDGYSDWYKVYTDNDYEGYVAAQYMKEYNETNYSQNSNNNNGISVDTIVGTWKPSHYIENNQTKYFEDTEFGFIFYADGTGYLYNHQVKDYFTYVTSGMNSYTLYFSEDANPAPVHIEDGYLVSWADYYFKRVI